MAEFAVGFSHDLNLDMKGNRVTRADWYWSGQAEYAQGDIVIYNNVFYIAREEISAPNFGANDNPSPDSATEWNQVAGLKYLGSFEGQPRASHKIAGVSVNASTETGGNTVVTVDISADYQTKRNTIRGFFKSGEKVYFGATGTADEVSDGSVLGTAGFAQSQADFHEITVDAQAVANNVNQFTFTVSGTGITIPTNALLYVWDAETPATDVASVWYNSTHEEFHYYDNNGDLQTFATKEFVINDAITLYPTDEDEIEWLVPEGFELYRNSIWIYESALWRYYGYSMTDADQDGNNHYRRVIEGDNNAAILATATTYAPQEPRNLTHLDATAVDANADPVQGRLSVTRVTAAALADTVGNATAFFDLAATPGHYAISNVGKTFTFSSGDATLYRIFNTSIRDDGETYAAAYDQGLTGVIVGGTVAEEIWISETERDDLLALITTGDTVTSDGVTITRNDVYNRLEWFPLGIGGGSVTNLGDLQNVTDPDVNGRKIITADANGNWSTRHYDHYTWLTDVYGTYSQDVATGGTGEVTSTEFANYDLDDGNTQEIFGLSVVHLNADGEEIVTRYKFGSEATRPVATFEDTTYTITPDNDADEDDFRRFKGAVDDLYTIAITEEITPYQADGTTEDTTNTFRITDYASTLQLFSEDSANPGTFDVSRGFAGSEGYVSYQFVTAGGSTYTIANPTNGLNAAPTGTLARTAGTEAQHTSLTDLLADDDIQVRQVITTFTVSDQNRVRFEHRRDIDAAHEILGPESVTDTQTTAVGETMKERAAATYTLEARKLGDTDWGSADLTANQFEEDAARSFDGTRTLEFRITITDGTFQDGVSNAQLQNLNGVLTLSNITLTGATISTDRDVLTYTATTNTDDPAVERSFVVTALPLVSTGKADTTTADVTSADPVDGTDNTIAVTITAVTPAFTLGGLPAADGGNVDVFALNATYNVDIATSSELNDRAAGLEIPFALSLNGDDGVYEQATRSFTLQTQGAVWADDASTVTLNTDIINLPTDATNQRSATTYWQADYTDARFAAYSANDQSGSFTVNVYGYVTAAGNNITASDALAAAHTTNLATFVDAPGTLTFDATQEAFLYVPSNVTVNFPTEGVPVTLSSGFSYTARLRVDPGQLPKTITLGTDTVTVQYVTYRLPKLSDVPGSTATYYFGG